MSQTLGTQLFSTKWRAYLDSSGGHSPETAITEIIDNSFDAEAKNITIFINPNKNSFALLDDGSGFSNIEHSMGSGTGLKVKTKGKIGNKNTGMFASIAHFNSKKTYIMSKYKDHSKKQTIPINQQIVLYPEDISEICNRPGIDLDVADKLIREGVSRKIFIDASIGNRDNLISGDVEDVIEIFQNDPIITSFLKNKASHGTLICFVFETNDENGIKVINEPKFNAFYSKIEFILKKMQFITYNTARYLRSKEEKQIRCINLETKTIITLNNSSCKNGFLLGKTSFIDKTDEYWEEDSTNNFFENLYTNKVIKIENFIYRNTIDKKLYNLVNICNIDKLYRINETGDKILLPDNFEIKEDGILAKINISFSVISKEEGAEQAEIMGLKQDNLRRIAFYYGGRFLNFDHYNGWSQERSLRDIRIAFEISYEAIELVNIQTMKSSIILDNAHPVIINTISKIICPLVSQFHREKYTTELGLNDWLTTENENIIRKAMCLPTMAIVSVPTTVPVPVTVNTLFNMIAPVSNQKEEENTTDSQQQQLIQRSATVAHTPLNKTQAKQRLNALKTKIDRREINGSKKSGDKSQLFTLLSKISKELVFEDNLWNEYIDSVINLIDKSDGPNTRNIVHASELHKY